MSEVKICESLYIEYPPVAIDEKEKHMASNKLNPAIKYNVTPRLVKIMYNLINIIIVCLTLGVICSVLPSAKNKRFKLPDEGTITSNKTIIPKPPNHWVNAFHIEKENAWVCSGISEKPVVVIHDIASKNESKNPSSPDIKYGSPEKIANNPHILRTNINDPFNERFVNCLFLKMDSNIRPEIIVIMEEYIKECKNLVLSW